MKKALIIFSILILFPVSAFSQENPINEAAEWTDEAIEATKEEAPGIFEGIWKNEVLPIWKGMYEWGVELWNKHFKEFFDQLKENVFSFFEGEIEKRKDTIGEEFEKEKEELKKEVPEVGMSLWEKLKAIIK